MDIFKIGRVPSTPQVGGTKKSNQSSEDRDPQQSGQDTSGGRDEPATHEEAKSAAAKLESSPHFLTNALTVEVRENDGKHFLDIFDPQKRKIKTIGAVGIRAILSSYNTSERRGSSILDRRV